MARMTRTGSLLLLAGACALALALLPAGSADARLGEPDPAFGGGDGIALLGIPGSGLGAAVLQPDGKVVVGGHAPDTSNQDELMVARLDAGGGLDAGFGAGGVVQWSGVEDGEVFDVALEAGGSILAAGAGSAARRRPAARARSSSAASSRRARLTRPSAATAGSSSPWAPTRGRGSWTSTRSAG
jgi:hypothetical protein